jgi:hypothetical protein
VGELILKHKFDFGQLVYIKTDPNQMAVQIVEIAFHVGGTVMYSVGCNGTYTDVYEAELTDEIDTLMKVTSC